LRTAERDRDAALAVAQAARAQLETQAAAHEAELRRQRARQAEAERSAETARRGTRTERDVDDARLWLLVDTLVQAAAGVRRELSLPAPDLRPADVVASADTEAGRRSAHDAAALDRLLAVPNVHVIVDGYNVTKTGYGELSLADQRARLVGALAALAAQSGAEVTVAFDGGAKPPMQPVTPRGVRVLFSAPDEIADDLIRRLVAAEPPGRPVVVVTSDQQVVADTSLDGAWSVPSAVLLSRLG
jgi:predicted RNA-binding protein with PIN domain